MSLFVIRWIFLCLVIFSFKYGIYLFVKRWCFLIGGLFYEKFNESFLGYLINGNRNIVGVIFFLFMYNFCIIEKLINNYFFVIVFLVKFICIKIFFK